MTEYQEETITKENDGGLFLLWMCLMKRATETGFPHHLFFLATGNPVT